MKISPRSTGGMNSEPTTPNGTSAIAPTKESTQIAMTIVLCRSAAGSARCAYQLRIASKPRAKPRMSAGGRQCPCSAQFPASDGVIVNETNSEVSVEITTTTPNSARFRPTWPCRNAIGRKTTTSTSVMTIAASPISFRPETAAACGACPSSKCRSMFSRTTVESSTRIPTTRVIPSSEIVSIVRPISFMTNKATHSDAGIATRTTIMLRHEPRKKSMTIPVRMMPSVRVRMTLSICCAVYFD